MAKPKKTYTPAPQVPAPMSERLEMIMEVLAGRRTVTEAARTLGMSRNHFQTILHRGLAGMVESITPQPSGRPGKPKEMLELEAQLERLKRENAHLQERVGTTDRLLEVASGLLQGRIRPARQSRTRKTAALGDEDKGEAEPARRRDRLAGIEGMRRCGLTASFAARVAGVHEATARRWRREEPRPSRRLCRLIDPAARAKASELVRALKGQVGADCLRHSVAGISRREAARVKACTLIEMERSRKAALTRVRVSVSGVLRGMDGMHFHAADGCVHALITADAAVAYRTHVTAGKHYDASLVARTLAADIEANGAPLVYRLDRAWAHDAQLVRELLEAHEVLVLHGPPHCPRFYGQLERQNREHRAWEDELASLRSDEVEPRLRQVLEAVNSKWRRRTLGWKTASEVWNARPILDVDRKALRQEVIEKAARIGRQLQRRGKPADLAQRLAIEQTLQTRGYLRQTIGGWC
jgi:transposase-like protein